jgi:cytochrome c
MKRTHSFLTVTAGVLALATFSLAACGGGGEAPKTEPKADAPKAEAPKAEAPKAETPTVTPVALVDLDITSGGAKLKGDPEAGKRTFAQCQACHALQEGRNMVGPSLHGIIGRTSGSVPNFRYSEANKSAKKVWTQQAMFDYLEDPRRAIPGTTMNFAGLKKVEDRANVIAYIKQQSGQLPSSPPK